MKLLATVGGLSKANTKLAGTIASNSIELFVGEMHSDRGSSNFI